MVDREIEIKLAGGLEARPVAMLVQVASQYESSVYIQTSENKRVNAKSIMGMMSLGLNAGEKVVVEANKNEKTFIFVQCPFGQGKNKNQNGKYYRYFCQGRL